MQETAEFILWKPLKIIFSKANNIVVTCVAISCFHLIHLSLKYFFDVYSYQSQREHGINVIRCHPK